MCVFMVASAVVAGVVTVSMASDIPGAASHLANPSEWAQAQSGATPDATAKRAALADAARSAPVTALVEVLQQALRDPDRTVRLAALGALASRASASRRAGSAPLLGPSPSGMARPASAAVPLGWRGDHARLDEALGGEVANLLRTDRDRQVRHAALIALGNLRRPEGADAAAPTSLVDLLIEVYQQDDDARVRAECVKSLRLMPNDSQAIRQVLLEALVDPSPAIQHEAQAEVTGPRGKISFADAEPALTLGLRSPATSVRAGAVRALNIFGARSARHLAELREMERTDTAQEVRSAAGLAIRSITGQPGEVR